MPITRTSEPKELATPCAGPADARVPSGARCAAAGAAAATKLSDRLPSVFRPGVRRFSPADPASSDASRNSGRVRRTPAVFRDGKERVCLTFARNPQIADKTPHNGHCSGSQFS